MYVLILENTPTYIFSIPEMSISQDIFRSSEDHLQNTKPPLRKHWLMPALGVLLVHKANNSL